MKKWPDFIKANWVQLVVALRKDGLGGDLVIRS